MSERPTWDQYFLSIAAVVATRSTCSRLSVGAVVVCDNRIQSAGYNGTPPGQPHCEHIGVPKPCSLAIHAEENALRYAEEPAGGTLYTTHAPCKSCAIQIGLFQIRRVVFSSVYRSEDGVDWLERMGIEVVQL